MDFESARRYLSRVAPFDGVHYINIHRKVTLESGGTVFFGAPFQTVDEAINHLEYLARTSHGDDIFLAMGSYKKVERKLRKKGGTFISALRQRSNLYACKAFYVDLDVKPDKPDSAYASTEDAISALARVCAAIPLPKPNVVVLSGTGGVHAYWTFSTPISVDDWQPRANAICASFKAHGLKFDSQCTVDPVRLLRIPGTWNAKRTPHLPVKLVKCGDA